MACPVGESASESSRQDATATRAHRGDAGQHVGDVGLAGGGTVDRIPVPDLSLLPVSIVSSQKSQTSTAAPESPVRAVWKRHFVQQRRPRPLWLASKFVPSDSGRRRTSRYGNSEGPPTSLWIRVRTIGHRAQGDSTSRPCW